MTGFGNRIADLEKAGYDEFQFWQDPAAADTDGVIALAATAAAQDVTTGLTNPDVARNLTATVAASTAAHIKAVQVTVYGTDYNDNEISEDLPAFTEDTAGSVAGSKAFKTVTRVVVPAMDGATAQVSIGWGNKLGFKKPLVANTVILMTADGVKETTAPTVAFDKAVLANNTIAPNTALNGARDFMVLWKDMRVADIAHN